MTTAARQDLEKNLQDPEFRKYFGAAGAKSELAVTLSYARHSLKITQEEMALKLGVSQPYIAKLESGEANPTIGTVGTMLAALFLRLKMTTAPLLSSPGIVGSGNATIAWNWATPAAVVAANVDFTVACVECSFPGAEPRYEPGRLFQTNAYEKLMHGSSGEDYAGIIKETGVLVGGSNN